MNHIYRLVWNKKRNMLMAVGEIGSAHGKEASGETRATGGAGATGGFTGTRTLLAAAMLSLFPLAAFAQVVDHTVAAGTTEYMYPDARNDEAASWNLRNDGGFDISNTDAGTRVVSLSGSGTVLLGEQTLTLTDAQGFYAGTLMGSGGLALGAGYEILGGANTYLGTTAIGSEATLALSGSGSIALSQGLLAGGVFDISATDDGATLRALSGSGAVALGSQVLTLTQANGAFAGVLRGDGGLEVAGGSATLTGTNTYEGATAIGADGTLALSGSGSIALSGGVVNDGVFDIGAANDGVQVRSLAGSGTVLLGNNGLALAQAGGTFAGNIDGNGGFAVNNGSEVLSGTNTYTGATAIGADGTLALSGSGSIALSSGVANNGVFDIAATNDGAEVQTLSGSGAVLLGGQTLTLAGAYDEFAGTVHGSGGLAIAAGGEVLSGSNTYTGATSIAQGATLALGGSGSIALSGNLANEGLFDIGAAAPGAPVQLQSLSGSGAVALGDNSLVLANAGGTFAGTIDGYGGFAVNKGSEVLSGTNTYTGATAIGADGTLALSGSGSIALSSGVAADGVFDIAAANDGARVQSLSGSGTVLLGGQTLTLAGAYDEFAGAIRGSGGLALAGGVETLSGTNTYTGATAIATDATLALSGSGSIALSSGVRADGTLDLWNAAGPAQLQSLSGSGAVLLGGNDLVLTNAGATFAGKIEGDGGLAVRGGSEVLSGANTYLGATTIAEGATLALSGSGSIALSSGVAADGVFDIGAANGAAQVRSLAGSGTVLLGNNNLVLTQAGGTFGGTIDGNGGLAVNGGSEVLSGTNTYTGATAIGADATLALSGSGSIALSSGVAADGIFDIAATDHGAGIGSLSGAGTVQLGGQTLTLTQAQGEFTGSIHGSGGLAVAGGHEILSGANSYTGATTVAQGAALVLAGAGSIAQSSGLQADGYVDVSGVDQGAQLASLSGSGSVWLGSQDLTLTNASGTFAGHIDSNGGLAVSGGTQTLAGANGYTGATAIGTDGTLVLSGSGAVALSSGVANDGTLDIAATDNGAEVRTLSGSGTVLLGGQTLTLSDAHDTFAGAIRGSGGLAIAAGTETLTGTNTYTGATAIGVDGTLALSGSGSIALSSGIVNDGTLNIAGTDNGAQVQSLSGSGTVLLGGQDLTLSEAGGTFAGVVQGSGGLAVGGGSEVLSGTNTYTGATNVAEGATLALAGSGSIALSSGVQADGVFDVAAANGGVDVRSLSGSGAVLLGDNALTLTQADGSFAGNIAGNGGLALTHGSETLSGTNTYTGTTSIGADGTLVLSGSGSIALSGVVVAQGTFDIAATDHGAEIQSLAGAGAVQLGGQTLTLTSAQGEFTGAIQGSGGLAIGGGYEVLGGTNTYTGATTVAQGAGLILSGAGSIAQSSGLQADGFLDIADANQGAQLQSLSGSGSVWLGNQDLTLTNAAGTFAGHIDGNGGLAVTGGTQTLAGYNGYSGATAIGTDGTLALSGSGSIALSSGVANDGTLDIAATNNGAEVRTLSGSGTVLLGGQTLTLADAHDTFGGAIHGSGGLAIAAGTETLTGTNTYTGATAIGTNATLALSGSGSIALSSGIANDGTLNIAGTANGAHIQSLSGSGAVLLGQHDLTLTGAHDAFAGHIDGNGGLAVSGGTQTLGGANTYTGATAIGADATLALSGSGSIALSSGVANDGTLDIAGTDNGAQVQSLCGSGAVLLGGQTLTLSAAHDTFAGTIQGSGGLAIGAGSETLSGRNSYSGDTVIARDATLALAGNGSIANSRVTGDGTLDVSASSGGAAVKGLSGSGAVLLGGQDLALTDAHDTYTGSIKGSGGVTVAGGTATFTGANAYTGVTGIDRGATLALSGAGSIALSGGIVANGVLDVTAAAADTQLRALSGSGAVLLGDHGLQLTAAAGRFDGAIQGSGGLAVSAGTQVLGGTNTYAGATAIGADGRLSLAGSGSIALSSGVVNDGILDIAATRNGAAVKTLSGSGAVLLGGQTLTLAAAEGSFAGTIQGSGGLAIGGGNAILSGNNTYSGTTSVARGAGLALEGAGSIANSRAVVDGQLDLAAGTASLRGLSGSGAVLLGAQTLALTGADDTFAGRIGGSGGIAVTGGRETLAGTNNYSGATAIGARATLALSGSGSIALSSGVVNDGTFDIAATRNGAAVTTLSGSGAVVLGSQTLTLSNASGTFAGSIGGAGGLAIAGGKETLTGVNGYSGDTTIASGATLALSGRGSIAASRVTGNGTLDVSASSGGAAVRSLAGAGSVVLGSQTLTLTSAADTFSGRIGGAGGLAVTGGTATLAGTNAFTGATTIGTGATLALAGTGSLAASSGVRADGTFDIQATSTGAAIKTLSGAGSVALGGQTLTLTGAAGTFGGTIAGSGGLAIAAGTETLSGINSYSGDTAIAQGATLALAGKGSLAASRVSGAGTLDIAASTGAATVKSLGGSGSVLLGGQTLTLAHAGDTFGGAIAGSGGLALSAGVQALAAAQGYTGVTSIATGATLALSGKGAIAASSKVIADGSLDIAASGAGATVKSLSGAGAVLLGSQGLTLGAAADTFAGVISGSGTLDLAHGTEVLGGTNTYTGATGVGKDATLALAGSGSVALSSGVAADGVFDIAATTNGAAIKSLSGAGTVALGGKTLTLSAAAGTFDGSIGGAGGLAIAGGKAVLAGANAYTGATTIARGATLALSGTGSIAASTVVGADGTFDIAAAAQDVSVRNLNGSGAVLLGANDLVLTAAAGRFDGTLSGNGGLLLAGGKLQLTGSNAYTGTTIVRNATLQTGADANLGTGKAALQLDNGTWNTVADLTHARGLDLTGRGIVDVDAATTTIEDGIVAGNGALVKQGTGTLILRGTLSQGGGLQVNAGTVALTGANTYTGGTTIGSGALLRIDTDANLGALANKLTIDGGTLQTTGTMTSARAVEVTAKNGVVDTEGADSVVTLEGNLTGAGRIVKDGDGTLVLAGDNAGGRGGANQYGDGWTGGLTINSGLVKVTNAWGLGWGDVMTFNSGTIYATVDIATGQDIRIGRSTAINTEAGTVTTLAGDLISTGVGDGCFTKTGLGTLNVTGAARVDSTCVLEGKLLANGSFASKVTVAHGATLGGSGYIQGDVLVQGTLSPGNSPGMLTADSHITMAAGSTYKEDLGGTQQASATSPVGAAGYYSYLHVVGGQQFTIQPGATLAPTLKNLYSAGESGYGSAALVPELGQTYRIVTADGGIQGRFDTLAQPDGMAANTRFAAFYNYGGNDSIELKVLPASYASWFKDGNANARAAGAALDRVADLDQAGKGSAVQTDLLYRTASSSAQKLGGLVQGLSGEVHGALAAALPQAGWELQRTVLKHGAADDGRALWLDLGAGRAKWSGDDAASGFDADRVQVTAGLDVLRGRDGRIGFGASYAGTNVDAEGGNGKLRQNKVFAYGELGVNGVVLDGLASIGRDRSESHRSDPFAPAATLAARADGDSSMLGLGVRLPGKVDGARFEPFARVTVQRVRRDALAEASSSPAALALDGWTATGTRVLAGLSGSSRNADPLQASTYRFNLGAGVDAGGLARLHQDAVLAGTAMAIGAPDTGRAFVQGGASGTLQLKKGAYLYFGVTGEARSNYYTVGGNAGVRAVF